MKVTNFQLFIIIVFLLDGDKIGWGEMYLYFGCRKSAVDYIYKEELDSCLQDDVLTKVYTAFSREPGQPKVT